MDNDIAQSLIRKVLTAVAGWLIGHGLLPSNSISDAVINELAALILLGVTTWWSKRHQTKMKGKRNEKTRS